jgi:predicted nuclease with TOPRIM domain
MENETLVFKKKDVDKLKDNFRQLREEIDRLKHDKAELEAKLEPKDIGEVFEFEEETEEVEDINDVVNYGSVEDLNLNVAR